MRIVLLCAGEIGYKALEAILEFENIEIACVFSYHAENEEHFFSSIQDLCNTSRIVFFDDNRVDRPIYSSFWEREEVDYIISVKWRNLISQNILGMIKRELIVFHASLLPSYRGFAPINWQIINGEERSGVTMFYGSDSVDAGDIIEQISFQIKPADDANSISKVVAATVIELLNRNLPRLYAGTAARTPQDHSKATYAIWRKPQDGKIDWESPTIRIHNLVRGLTLPFPGAFTYYEGKKLIIWKAEIVNDRRYVARIPGRVECIISGSGVNVLTGDGILKIKDVQVEGESVVCASQLIRSLKTSFT